MFVSRKEYKALEVETDRLRRERDTALAEVERLRTAIEKSEKGELICSNYCGSCEHGVSVYQPFGGITTYICDTACKCKEYKRKA